MNLLIGCLGLIIGVVSIAAVISPGLLSAMTGLIKVNTGLRLFAGLIRIILGAALYYNAAATALPIFISITGIVIALAGVVLLFIPTATMQLMLDWFTTARLNARLVGGAGVLFSVPFAYAGLAML